MTSTRLQIEIPPDRDALIQRAAEVLEATADAAVRRAGRFTVALAGGGTPAPLYALLATPAYAHRLPWARTHVFWGDERCVPPTDAASNYRMAHEALLRHVPVPPSQVHRMRGELDPHASAAAYAADLRHGFGEVGAPDAVPRFDLVLLGLGPDGHTASLFPGGAAVHERGRWVVAEYVPVVSLWRVTLTPVVLNAARLVVFLVSGSEKADAVARVLEGPRDPARWPAQVVAPTDGHVHWLMDAEAAAALSSQ